MTFHAYEFSLRQLLHTEVKVFMHQRKLGELISSLLRRQHRQASPSRHHEKEVQAGSKRRDRQCLLLLKVLTSKRKTASGFMS